MSSRWSAKPSVYSAYHGFLEGLPKGLPRLAVVLSVNWVHQGFLSLGTTDRLGKVALELGLFFAVAVPLSLTPWFPGPLPLVVAVLAAHTGNWVLNTNVHASLRIAEYRNLPPESLEEYAVDVGARLGAARIRGALLLGSGGRGDLDAASDLDVHVIRQPGPWGGLVGVLNVIRERTRAFLRGIPLDIYLEDGITPRVARQSEAAHVLAGDPRLLDENVAQAEGTGDP